jgi:transcriptional regulator with XRE-family HTH domain
MHHGKTTSKNVEKVGKPVNHVGEQLKTARTQKGFSPKELSRKLGVSPSFILDVESGKRIINDKLLSKAAKVLGCDFRNNSLYGNDIESSTLSTTSNSPNQNKAAAGKQTVAPMPQWEHAFSNALTDIPIYDLSMTSIIDTKKAAPVNNKIEGYSPDKLLYVQVQDDEMNGFRLSIDDIVLIYRGNSISAPGLYLIEADNRKMIREIKELSEKKLLAVSCKKQVDIEVLDKGQVNIIGKCIKAEIRL